MRTLAVCGLLSASTFVTFATGCGDTKKSEPTTTADGDAEAKPAEAKPSEVKPPEQEPTPAAPPAPEGAVTLAGPPLFVQTCAEANPCPALLQAEGERHCSKLTLGTAHGWRLPTRQEVERMRGIEGLAELTGYHWTSSAFDQDEAQVWIVDPSSDQPTTVPRDRKPFRIRCVKEP